MHSLGWRLRVFLGGQALSAIGSWATLVAVWGYAAFAFDSGAAEIGFIGVAWLLPGVALAPVAGMGIDSMGPKRVLIAAKGVGAAASVALIFVNSYGWLVLLSVGHGIAYAFYQPALDAVPPRAVPDELLARTNALVRVFTDTAIIFGPVAAAATIALWDFRGAFAFDAVTYLVGIAAILPVSMRPPEAAPPSRRVWHEALEGFRLIVQRPSLRMTVLLTGTVYFLYGAALVIEPIYVRDVLHQPVSTFALLQTAFGVFLVGAGLLVARLGERSAHLEVVALTVVGSGLGAMLYLGTTSLAWSYTGVMAWGAVTAFVAGPSRTLLQRNTPEQAQGRVLALDRSVEGLAHLLALPLAGWLAATSTVRTAALTLTGAVALVGLAGVALVLRKPRTSGAGRPVTGTEQEPSVPPVAVSADEPTVELPLGARAESGISLG